MAAAFRFEAATAQGVAVDVGVALHANVTPETEHRLALRPGDGIACMFTVHFLRVLL